ncbi:MAG: hypothetical protein AAB036_04330 [Elusimicrobiota bacterium]
MDLRRAVLPAVVLALIAAASFGQSPSLETYNAKLSPLDELSRELLTETGYVIREDGIVWDKRADEAVRSDEMAYLLSRLAGARRLKALLELELILNRSEGEKRLTAAEREAVRKLVRQHWPVFGVGTRRDFKSYFSVEEREALNKIPPRFDRGSALLMRDPPPVTAALPEETAAPSPIAPPTEPAAEANSTVYPKAVLTPFLEPFSLRRPSPFAPRRPPEPARAGPPATVVAPPAVAPAAAPAVATPLTAPKPAPPAPSASPPLPAGRPAAAPAPSRTPIAMDTPALGVLKPWTPADAPASSATATSSADDLRSTAPAAAPALPPPAPERKPAPGLAETSQADFDAFVANGPYSREGQALLKLVGDKAPDYCRAILRRTVVQAAPLIVFDGSRAGTDRRAGFAASAAGSPPVIALSPGALLLEHKTGLFKRNTIAAPEDPRAWAEFGIAPPAIEAAGKGAVSSGEENSAWGATKTYGDRSRRGSYSKLQQAGELLERLLLVGLEREGYASSVYAARKWARTARLLFSARHAAESGDDSFLDPDRRLELKDWIEQGDEADDLAVGTWSSARGNVLDPRRAGPDSQALYERQARPQCARALLADQLAETARAAAARVRTLESLQEAKIITAEAATSAAKKFTAEAEQARSSLLKAARPCDGRFGAEEAGLRRSQALVAEATRAERSFRDTEVKGEGHDRN